MEVKPIPTGVTPLKSKYVFALNATKRVRFNDIRQDLWYLDAETMKVAEPTIMLQW